MADIQTKVRAFLSKFLGNYEVTNDGDIFASGLVNSMFAMELVLFVEKEFNVKIESSDLDIDNFRTIQAISELVAGKTGVLQG